MIKILLTVKCQHQHLALRGKSAICPGVKQLRKPAQELFRIALTVVVVDTYIHRVWKYRNPWQLRFCVPETHFCCASDLLELLAQAHPLAQAHLMLMSPLLQPSFRMHSAASGQSSSAVHALQPLSLSNCTNHRRKPSCPASTPLQAVRASAANQQGFTTRSEPLQAAAGSSWAQGSQPSNGGVKRQRQPIWLQPLRFDDVWYLGYGSNMNPQVLTGRRRVRPQQSMPCYVPGYTLSFGVQGFPWAEPGFATIQPCRADSSSCSAETLVSPSSWRRHVYAGNPCLHAVLHRVTKQEWAAIKASEGVLGSDNSSIGYQVGNFIVAQLRL
jgi:hypothetical protein